MSCLTKKSWTIVMLASKEGSGRANDVRQDLGLRAFLPGAFCKSLCLFPVDPDRLRHHPCFLPKMAEGYYWVGSIILLAVMIYCVLMFLKGMLLAMKWRGRRGGFSCWGSAKLIPVSRQLFSPTIFCVAGCPIRSWITGCQH